MLVPPDVLVMRWGLGVSGVNTLAAAECNPEGTFVLRLRCALAPPVGCPSKGFASGGRPVASEKPPEDLDPWRSMSL